MINNQNNIVNGGAVNSVSQLAQPGDLAAVYLTPDALMSYCATRLRGIDDQIHTSMTRQQNANADSAVLSKLAEELRPPGGKVEFGKNDDVFKNYGKALLDAASAAKDPSVKQKLLAQANKFVMSHEEPPGSGKYKSDGLDVDKNGAVKIDGTYHSVGDTLDPDSLKPMTSEFVSNVQKDLNSDTELSMINLQSLMSQRQSSVQLITNMVQSLGDQLNKIAGNIGH